VADWAFLGLVKIDGQRPLGLEGFKDVLPSFYDKRRVESLEGACNDPKLEVFRFDVLKFLVGVYRHQWSILKTNRTKNFIRAEQNMSLVLIF